MTLCLGLPNVTAALRSPIENASVHSLSSPQLVSRESGADVPVAGEQQAKDEPPPSPVTQSEQSTSGGLGRLVGAFFSRQPKPRLDPLPDDLTSPEVNRRDDQFVRRWKEEEDTDDWIDHEK